MRAIGKIAGIILGNVILTFGLAAFTIPNGFLVGGATGIARSVEYFFQIDMSVTVAVINVVMFFLGLWILGKKFALTTIVSTILFPALLNRFLAIEALASLTSDRLLAAVFGGALAGVGLGLVMRLGGSTGGMDIPPLAVNKKFKIPVAVTMYCIDVAVLLSQVLFSGVEEILYGIVSVLLTSVMVNQMLVFGGGNVQVMIISQEAEAINQMIQQDLDKGSTFVQIQTGFERQKQQAILCVLPNRDLNQLSQGVQKLDPKAFIIINGVREVRGRGFTLERQ